MKKHMSKNTMYVLAGVSVIVLFIFVSMTYLVLHKNLNPTPFPRDVVIDFKDCKKRGYQIVDISPETCKTPNGTLFMNLEEYLSITDVDQSDTVMKRKSYDNSGKSQATSTYRGIR
jgi:hypothetical protein